MCAEAWMWPEIQPPDVRERRWESIPIALRVSVAVYMLLVMWDIGVYLVGWSNHDLPLFTSWMSTMLYWSLFRAPNWLLPLLLLVHSAHLDRWWFLRRFPLLALLLCLDCSAAVTVMDDGRAIALEELAPPDRSSPTSWRPHPADAPVDAASTFVALRGALPLSDIASLYALRRETALFNETCLVEDRTSGLVYRHRAYRFESIFHEALPEVYEKIIKLIRRVDANHWRATSAEALELERGEFDRGRQLLFPEIEWIEYEHVAGQPLPYIEPHVDNDSVLTWILLLSSPFEFEGGINLFEGVAGYSECATTTQWHTPGEEEEEGNYGMRELELGQGDAVVFRGELLEHSITPVQDGLRTILQIELARYSTHTHLSDDEEEEEEEETEESDHGCGEEEHESVVGGYR